MNSFEFPVLVNTLLNIQAPVVQKVDSQAIHWTCLCPVDLNEFFFLILIHLIMIYPVDSASPLLNN